MYFTIKAVLRSLLLPPASSLILAVVGALLIWRGRRYGGWMLATGLGSLWLLSTPLVADAVSRAAEHYPALDLAKPTGAQAIVILGGGGLRIFAPEYAGPEAEFGLLERLCYGAYVARLTALPILVSGAPEEAATMRESLSRDFGITVRWVDAGSRDTFENARLSATVLQAAGIRRIILITGSAHLWRSSHEFQQAGFDVVAAPSGVWAVRERGVFLLVPSPAALMRSNLAIYELIGEPMRRLQAAFGVREHFDRHAVGTAVSTANPPG